ncbi:uncharacterized protein LOC125874736 [Solanum stenotomum]|uniref:uncharacterized protein LOC125874736 n=1 Tax=Solanum stenotomum TaxID=172797 RepID=UPI0020D0D6C5|nr:uncharacterized protein LOC125874736 [Solanum stenotomum]
MAPRGRPRKRLSRMDAATDAMTAFGFDERLVQKTVKQLLKEYGGDDGWAFIEEYGYKELIEAILRDQESNDEDSTKQKGVSSQVESAEDPALQSILGPSGTLVDSTDNKAGTTVGETSCSELVNAPAPIYVELCRNKQDICSTVFCPPPVEGDGNSWKDVVEGQISTQKEMGNAVCCDGGNSKNQVQSGSNSHDFASPPTSSPCPVNYLKLCSGSHVQLGNDYQTASLCPVNHVAPPVDHHPTALPSSKQGFSSQDERAEDPALLSTTCPSGTLNSTNNESGNTLGETGCSQLADAVEPTHEELCGNKQDIGSTEVLCLPPAEGCKDIEEDQTSYIQKRPANVFCNDGGNSGSRGSNFNVTVPPTSVNSVLAPADHIPTTLPSSKRVCLQPPRRSFPCYGWIESDSEEDADDFILLPPMKCVGI